MEEAITLRKRREFGEVFNATFIFIRQEFKLLGRTLLYVVVPVSVIIAIISSLNQWSIVKNMGGFMSKNIFDLYSTFAVNYLVTYVLIVINQALIMVTVYSYISLYLEKGKDNFEMPEIISGIKSNFFPVLLACLLMFVMIIIGTMFCVIPGIYFSISLSLTGCIMLVEKKSIGDAISRSFSLVGLQWWWTFLILFVAIIIIGLISYIFAIPLTAYGFTIGLHSVKNPAVFENSMSSFVLIYTAITSLITSLLYIIPYILIAFQYFNIVEIKEKTSLKEKIDQLSNEQQ